MTQETFDKAKLLQGQICSAKGAITTWSQKLSQTKDVLKIEYFERRINEKVAILDNLRKQFKDL